MLLGPGLALREQLEPEFSGLPPRLAFTGQAPFQLDVLLHGGEGLVVEIAKEALRHRLIEQLACLRGLPVCGLCGRDLCREKHQCGHQDYDDERSLHEISVSEEGKVGQGARKVRGSK